MLEALAKVCASSLNRVNVDGYGISMAQSKLKMQGPVQKAGQELLNVLKYKTGPFYLPSLSLN